MIWALLAILGVPLWLIVGLLLGVVLSRKNFRNQEGVFALAVRSEGAAKWPRGLIYGRRVRNACWWSTEVRFILRTEFHVVDQVADLALGAGPEKLGDAVGRLLTATHSSDTEIPADRTTVKIFVRA